MRILHVIAGLNIGGAEQMLCRLIDGNRTAPKIVHEVVSLTTLGTLGERLKAEGVAVTALNLRGLGSTPRGFLQLWRAIRQARPNVVHTWMYHADFLGGLAARIARCPKIIWGIRATSLSYDGNQRTIRLMRLCAALSHLIPTTIVCAAQASKNAHIAAGYDAAKMVVVPNGFEVDLLRRAALKRQPQRKLLGLADDDIVVTAIGRFTPVKDFEGFVAAAGEILRSCSRVRFMMIGRGLSWDNLPLVEQIRQAGILERTLLLGERVDVPECLAATDIFCLSSKSEGFPNVVGEAMGVGVPCVVTDVGDASILVGDTGVVVPQEDSPALARGVLKLVSMSEVERKYLGSTARKRIEDVFSLPVARRRYHDLYI